MYAVHIILEKALTCILTQCCSDGMPTACVSWPCCVCSFKMIAAARHMLCVRWAIHVLCCWGKCMHDAHAKSTRNTQELLKYYAKPEAMAATPSGSRGTQQGNELFAALSGGVQALVSPYLHSSYTLTRSSGVARKVLFSSDSGASFRRWLSTWLRQIIEHHSSGNMQALDLPAILNHCICQCQKSTKDPVARCFLVHRRCACVTAEIFAWRTEQS